MEPPEDPYRAAGEEAPALLDALWETAPVGLAYFDTALRYRRVNGAVLDIDGGSVDERLGRTLEEVHGATGAVIAASLRRALADGAPQCDVPIQGRLWHGRGRQQEWRMSFYPVFGPDGAAVGVGVVLREVTSAERARRGLAEVATQRAHALVRYQSLVEATSAAVWIRDARGDAVEDAPALRSITGQDAEGYLGRGFLDAVHATDRERLRAGWDAAAGAAAPTVFTTTYRLCTADGGSRWFRTRAVPVRRGGRVVEWIGTEADIDDEVRARARLDLLARVTVALGAALEPAAMLTALAEITVPDLADLCRVYLVDPTASDAAGPLVGRRSVTRTARDLPPPPAARQRFVLPAQHPITRSSRSGEPILVEHPLHLDGPSHAAPELIRWSAQARVTSMLVAPVRAGGTTVAALLFLACGDRARYTGDDLALVGELAARASVAVEHAAEFQQSRRVAVALQVAMLTDPPRHPGMEIEARYVAAVAELEVGGDWYDAFTLPGGDLGVVVGDVAGHDVPAATVMGQLRSMLRALAHDSDAGPSDVLRRLDRVAHSLDVTRFTTLLYGRISRRDGRCRFCWSNAGHPGPLVVGGDGAPRPVGGAVGRVLGLVDGGVRTDCEAELAVGETLLLHTDGLVEHRHDPDDRSAAELRRLIRSGSGLGLSDFCDHLVRATTADTGDDMVVLAVRITG